MNEVLSMKSLLKLLKKCSVTEETANSEETVNTEKNTDRESSADGFTVKQTGAAYGVGVFILASAALFSFLETAYHVKEITVWIYLILLGIFLLGGYVLLEAWNRRLTVEEDLFSYRNLLGKTVSFSIGEVAFGKAAYNASKGRDYLRLYDKDGKALCRLECSMKNAPRLVWHLHEYGVPIGLEAGAEGYAGDIIRQRPLTEDMLEEQSGQVFEQMQGMAERWLKRNRELGAELEYGFACYFAGKMEEGARTQPAESHFTVPAAEKGKAREKAHVLPEDFLCRMELYVKKDGCLVCGRRGRLIMAECTVFYGRKCTASEGGYRLYHNGIWLEEMEEALGRLERYLPKHRFTVAQEPLGYPLWKVLF